MYRFQWRKFRKSQFVRNSTPAPLEKATTTSYKKYSSIDYLIFQQDICEHEVVVADAKAHAAGWLSLGTLYNRLILKLIRYPRMTRDMKLLAFLRTVEKVRGENYSWSEKRVHRGC